MNGNAYEERLGTDTMLFGSVPITGFAQGFVPIISYNYGHGYTARVRECFRISLITMFSFNAAVMLLMIIFPGQVASMFTSMLALILPSFWGVKGVFAAESMADATAAVCCTIIFMMTFPKILKKGVCSRS